jgi:hypothetical protein
MVKKAKKFVGGLLLAVAIVAFLLTGWYLEFIVLGYLITPVFDTLYEYSPDLVYLVILALVLWLGVMIGRGTSSRNCYL